MKYFLENPWITGAVLIIVAIVLTVSYAQGIEGCLIWGAC